ncbi:SPFH domain-containing protein [Salinigranum halophilum]|uniref:SPFH domain-containing protein n=1 Tax=Salinigranum halophilum TaxID=2565931 RepID=UPI0010A8F47A|nr:SPFH domain-containing protein [Salinigranum halophilum]
MSFFRWLGRTVGRLTTDGSSTAVSERGGLPGALKTGLVAVVLVALAFLVVPITPVTVIGLAVLALAVSAVYSAVEIVEAYETRALTVFGEYRGLLRPGLNVVPPFVSRTYAFDMRTQTFDVPSQEAITEDNSPVTADAVVYIRVMDAKRAFLEVDDYRRAVSLLAQTTLRAALGDMELDQTLSRRDQINDRIRKELDEPTDRWGIRVESVEVREVTPSADVVNAMEEQTSAERHRRAMILEAQGERRSAIERAEGEKQAAIVESQGKKQAAVLEAQGDAIATVLRARSAESMGERAIIDKGMETLGRIGQAPSTTYVLPQELTSLLGRYGRQLTESDVQESAGLDSLAFDADTRELLGLDSVDELVEMASDVTNGESVDAEVEFEYDTGEGDEAEMEFEYDAES